MNRSLNGIAALLALGLSLLLAAPARGAEQAPASDASPPAPGTGTPARRATPAEMPAEMPRGVIRLDETVISGNQELPKVLYIVPWQQPDGLPEIELKADFAEVELFRRLYPPAYRRELGYHEASTTTADSNVNDSKE